MTHPSWVRPHLRQQLALLDTHGNPRTPQDLTQHDCMVFRDRDAPFGTWKLKGPQRWETVTVTGSLASNDSDVALRWCLEGRGIVMMADWNVDQELADGRLVRVLPKWSQPADVWAVTVARSDQSAKVRVCIEYLKRELAVGEYALIPPDDLKHGLGSARSGGSGQM
ncbi:LysR substrate-binding domain-containing protein [Pseudomonas putida]